jgi:hypothetical protein
MNEQAMKTEVEGPDSAEPNELLEHYEFDYSKARPNRFADRIGPDTLMVVLDPDVAAVFPTAESVNSTLRAIAAALANLPAQKPARQRKRSTPGA